MATAEVTDDDVDALGTAKAATEHITHHGQPLRFIGSSYREYTEHRFGCRDPQCRIKVAIRVTGFPIGE